MLLRNLRQMGYHAPKPIQAAVIESALQGRDILGLAPTGSGKTAAFMTPVIHALLSKRPGDAGTARKKSPIRPAQRLRALVLCPTRELAQQVQKESGLIAQGSVLRTACVYGKSAVSPQAQAIARGIDVLVGTPGRVIELLDARLLSLSSVQHVVIDEGDRMLDMGFLPQVEKILERVGGTSPTRQVMLFSATMPSAVETLARTYLSDPQRIEIGRHTTPVSHVQQHLVPVSDEHKVSLLMHLLTASGNTNHRRKPSQGTVLVFCRTRRRVGWVGTALQRHGIAAGMLHGDRSQMQRQKALDAFRSGELRVLVATDVAARGLHIPGVRIVINYDLPAQPEEYVHRVGRAAHGREGEAVGEAYAFLDADERMKWRAILNTTGIDVFAEHEVAGWSAPQPRRSRTKRKEAASAPAEQPKRETDRSTTRGSKVDPLNRARRKRGRSHASKPISKNQRPGKGVRRA